MIVGYIRMCTQAEDRDREKALHQWGAEKLYWEKDSSRSWVRPAYEEMAATLQPGDTVVVSEFRQLAGSARDVLILLHRLYSAKVEFASLQENFHTATGQGRETLRVLSALAEMEEERMLRRQKNVEKAKAAGRYKGRTPLAIDEEKFRAVCTRWRAGEMTAVAQAEYVLPAGQGFGPVSRRKDVTREKSWTIHRIVQLFDGTKGELSPERRGFGCWGRPYGPARKQPPPG